MPWYVNVDGIPLEFLGFMGYNLVAEDDHFILLNHKGQDHVLPKEGPRFLYVEDDNDAAILRSRPRIPAPPAKRDA
jgi:hypothetical protein